jgi:transcriptional regulator with PAS, ATPase and Fis domain
LNSIDTTGQSQRGILVVDTDGNRVSAGGLALDNEVTERMLDGWRAACEKQQRVFVTQGANAQSAIFVVCLSMSDATVLVAMQREARDPLFELVSTVEFAGDILAHFLTNPFEALTVVDRQGILRYMSPVHERFFGESLGRVIGRHVTEVIENTRLHSVAATGQAEIGSLQTMRGVTRVVTRHPIKNDSGATVGAIGQVMFKGPAQLQMLSEEAAKLKSEVAYYRRELDDLRNRNLGLDEMVGESAAMVRLKQQIVKVAPLDVPVLLTGESGTGKELAAHALHKLSVRRDANMVMVNAAALPSTLVETELFGYEGGAFTGAERKGRKGKIEQADHGTLFLDEIGDMPADVQVKLLRVLQDGSFQRVGGHESRTSNFRLISATNCNFEAMIANGTFRLDLFYRIGVVIIRLPALRERLSDIPLLAERVLSDFSQKHGHPKKNLSAESVSFLTSQNWPGNVRQFMHAVERAAIFSDTAVIHPRDFDLLEKSSPDFPFEAIESVPGDEPAESEKPSVIRVSDATGQIEEQLIRRAMRQFRGNKKRVATELGISRSYLYKRLGQMGELTGY